MSVVEIAASPRLLRPASASLVSEVLVDGFRSVRGVTIAPEAVSALVGDAQTGKSNLLAAIRAALDPTVAVSASDVPLEDDGTVAVRVLTACPRA